LGQFFCPHDSPNLALIVTMAVVLIPLVGFVV
jgi:hypothetical protein